MDTSSVGVQGIEAVCADQGIGEALLCVHGWGAWHRYWRHLWPRIVQRFRSLAVDLPGFGRSEKPKGAPYTIEWFADWLVALLDVKGIARAHVVGHSMGGTIAVTMAARHPDRVGRLVLLNPLVEGSTALSSRARFLTSPLMLRLCHSLTGSKRMLRWMGKDFTSTERLEDEDLASLGMGSVEAMVASKRSMAGTDLIDIAGRVEAPALIVTSGADRILEPGQGAMLAEALEGSRRETLPGVGHCGQLESPERFNGLVMEWLSGAARPERPPQW